MKKEKFYLAFPLTAVLAMQIHAQEPSDTAKTKQLNEILISATKSEKNPGDVARSITLISSDEIKKSGANSLAELLSQYEGMYITGTAQVPGSQQSIFMRGASSNHTVILKDGVRITDPSSPSNAADLSEISLSDIDRIEIVRGSHGMGFGSSAIGGIINIITKARLKEGASGDVSIIAGIPGENAFYTNEDVLVGYKLKNGLFAQAGVSPTGSNGLNATVDTITNPKTFKHDNLSDGFSKTDLTGKIGFDTEKINSRIYFKKTYQLTDIDKRAYVDDENYTLDFSRSLIGYGFQYRPSAKILLGVSGGFSSMERIAINDSSVVDSLGTYDKTYSRGDYSGSSSDHEAVFSFQSEKINITGGAGMSQEKMNVNTNLTYYNAWAFPSPKYETILSSLDSVKPSATTISAFLNTELKGSLLNPKLNSLTLGLGGRISNHSVFGNTFTYAINPGYKINEKSMLYICWSTGFNAPSLYQLYSPTLYYTWDFNKSNGITLGNKTLKPETSATFEAGFTQRINENTQITLAYFETVVKNLIEYVYLWDKNIGIDTLGLNWGRDDFRADTYLNIGEQLIHGFEISFRSSVNQWLSLGGNISIASGRYKYSLSGVDTSLTKGDHLQVFSNGQFITKDIETYGLTRRPETGNLFVDIKPVNNLTLVMKVRHAGARLDNRYSFVSGPVKVSTYYIKDYTLLDFSARYIIWKDLVAILKIENILDERYEEINGFSTRQRSYYAGIRYSF